MHEVDLLCRFAMLGAAGVVVPGLLSKVGILNVPDWYVAGEVAIKDSGIPLGALISAQMFLMGWAEASRYQVPLLALVIACFLACMLACNQPLWKFFYCTCLALCDR
jgi:hypothetical protein